MVYYDFVRFLHERLRSESSAATYVFYYTHPTRSPIDNLLSGTPFPSRTDSNATDDIELHTRLIRYWTNFVRTGEISFLLGVCVSSTSILQAIRMNQRVSPFLGRGTKSTRRPTSIFTALGHASRRISFTSAFNSGTWSSIVPRARRSTGTKHVYSSASSCLCFFSCPPIFFILPNDHVATSSPPN